MTFWRKFSGNVKKRRKLGIILGVILLFLIFWVISALGSFRFFALDYFRIAGGPLSEKNYLLLFQNNTELRPTGGFISAYGILKFRHGFPVQLNAEDVYGIVDEHEWVDPPYPMGELLAHQFYQGYTFRDANFNPDFPESAQKLESFYQRNFPEMEFDGVMAFDLTTLEDLMGLLGEVEVDGVKFNQRSFFENLEEAVSDIDRHNVEELAGRKNIMQDLMQVLVRKLLINPFKTRVVSDLLVRELNEKHILLWFKDERLQEKVVRMNWGGVLNAAETDRLAVVEANLGGMKSDRYIFREVDYAVTIEDDFSAQAELKVKMTHRGDYNEPLSGQYKGYLRVFVPEGVEILDEKRYTLNISTGEISINESPEKLKNYLGLGRIVELKPGEEQVLTFKYNLPAEIIQDSLYALYLWKQPGTINDFYRVTVKAPAGMTVESNEFITRENLAVFEGSLTQDQFLNLKIQPDEHGPRIVIQEMHKLNEITIVLNETLEERAALDGLNYRIYDADVNEPEKHDEIWIEKVIYDGKAVILQTRGMTWQPEEHYKIEMQNLKDRFGNLMEPSPRTITVVQRLE